MNRSEEDNRHPHKLYSTTSLAEWKCTSYNEHIFRTCLVGAQSLPKVKTVPRIAHPCFQSARSTFIPQLMSCINECWLLRTGNLKHALKLEEQDICKCKVLDNFGGFILATAPNEAKASQKIININFPKYHGRQQQSLIDYQQNMFTFFTK